MSTVTVIYVSMTVFKKPYVARLLFVADVISCASIVLLCTLLSFTAAEKTELNQSMTTVAWASFQTDKTDAAREETIHQLSQGLFAIQIVAVLRMGLFFVCSLAAAS